MIATNSAFRPNVAAEFVAVSFSKSARAPAESLRIRCRHRVSSSHVPFVFNLLGAPTSAAGLLRCPEHFQIS